VDQVIYCCWCDPEGKVIDDGTITRLGENDYRWTAADPSLRWFRQNALGLDVSIEDISEQVRRVSFARADLRAPAARSDGRENREPEYFRADTPEKSLGVPGRHFAHGVYRAT